MLLDSLRGTAQVLNHGQPVNWNCPLNRGLTARWLGFAQGARVNWKGFYDLVGNRRLDIVDGFPGIKFSTFGAPLLGQPRGPRCNQNAYLEETGGITWSKLITAANASICCWVHPLTAAPGEVNANGTVMFGSIPVSGVSIGIGYGNITGAGADNGDRIWAYHNDSGGQDRRGLSGYTVGNWYHVFAVHTGGTLYCYVNGLLVDSVASTDSTTLAGYVCLGRGSQTFDGDIIDCCSWNRGLSANEVYQWYHDSKAGYPQTLNYLPRRFGLIVTSSGAMAGSSALSFGAGSSTLSGAGVLLGSSALLFAAGSSALTSIGALVGKVELFLTQTATGQLVGALAGSSDIIVTATGTLLGSGVLLGTSVSTITPTGTLLGSGVLLGSSDSALSSSATLLGTGALLGTVALAFTQAGDLQGTASGDISGTAAMAFAGSSTLIGSGLLAGSLAMVFAEGSSILSASGVLAGSALITFADTATITGAGSLAGSETIAFDSGASSLTGIGLLAGTSVLAFDAGASVLIGVGLLAGTSDLLFGSGAAALNGEGAIAGTVGLTITDGGTLLGAGVLAGSIDLVFIVEALTLIDVGTLFPEFFLEPYSDALLIVSAQINAEFAIEQHADALFNVDRI